MRKRQLLYQNVRAETMKTVAVQENKILIESTGNMPEGEAEDAS